MKLHETIEAQQRKPLLTIDEQISHLKEKGVTFESCTEEEAIEYLAGRCRFFKVTAYRKLFDKRVGGEKDGQYVDLDFAQLKYLASLDRRLRDALLPMTLDVEHFAAARLLNATENNGEDGYAVMRDYMEAVPANRRKYIENELEIRSSDAYCGAIIRKYREDMPIWAFVEVVSLETFIGLCKFCADRWGDDELLASHYLLKKAKSIRNASAPRRCVIPAWLRLQRSSASTAASSLAEAPQPTERTRFPSSFATATRMPTCCQSRTLLFHRSRSCAD